MKDILSMRCAVMLYSADSFYEMAMPTVERLTILHEVGIDKFADIVSSATNLALSLELYMKCLLACRGLESPMTHNLLKIFNQIPEADCASIFEWYRRICDGFTAGKQVELTMALPMEGEDSTQEPGFPEEVSDFDVESVLARSCDAFVSWRYFYERVDSGQGYTFMRYEFLRMKAICIAVRREIVAYRDR